MCIDYRDSKKAILKDDFPPLYIDVLIDRTTRHKMMSFMDGFFGYNQIMMVVEDWEKISFTTPWGTFCYKVMPFGLKNAGVTYQWAMTAFFHDMIHQEREFYVNDIILKSLHQEFEALVEVVHLFEKV